MDSEAQRVRDLVDAELPAHLQQDILRHLFKAYEQAWANSREFDPAQMRKEYGHLRLAYIEQSFKLLCAKYPGHLKPDDYRAPGGSYEYFTMMTRTLLITCSAVAKPDDMPRKATFRNTLAAGTAYNLFENVESVDGRKFFHVLLLHTAERRAELNPTTGKVRRFIVRDRPGFATLGVPERGGTEYLWRLPLFDAHPKTIQELRSLVVEDVPETQIPRRKRQRPGEQETGTGA